MGVRNFFSKRLRKKDANTIQRGNENNFHPLRVSTLYADLGESINKNKKIHAIVDYFLSSYYSYNIDVLCIQGIKSHRLLKDIIWAFKNKIEEHNDKNSENHNEIYVEYFPDVDIKNM